MEKHHVKSTYFWHVIGRDGWVFSSGGKLFKSEVIIPTCSSKLWSVVLQCNITMIIIEMLKVSVELLFAIYWFKINQVNFSQNIMLMIHTALCIVVLGCHLSVVLFHFKI